MAQCLFKYVIYCETASIGEIECHPKFNSGSPASKVKAPITGLKVKGVPSSPLLLKSPCESSPKKLLAKTIWQIHNRLTNCFGLNKTAFFTQLCYNLKPLKTGFSIESINGLNYRISATELLFCK